MLEQTFYSLSQWFGKQSGVSRSTVNTSKFQYLVDQPAWLALTNPSQYRQAVAENPVLYGCIDILASAAANGKKYLVDLTGQVVPWATKSVAVQNARRLFVYRPNPLQSAKEFNYERAYMFFTFGNNFVYLNNPLSVETDIINVQTMYNLPSEFVEVKQTGKIYDQVDIKGIIEKFSLTNYSPAKEFDPSRVILFNDINVSGIGNSIIGSSRLEMLKYPITNTQLAFEAMNVILKSRGMQGILKMNSKDATGTQIMLSGPLKDDVEKTFKSKYGLRENQDKVLFTYADVDYIKTIMNSQELGIYEEFSNNAMIISNGLGVPVELYKTYTQGATFENQVQAVRRLYQDTVIPKVENEDQYFTERLNLRKYGLELMTDFSHIPALQDAFKEKAAALSMNCSSADKAYNNNIITWNQYLELMDLEPVVDGDLLKSERDEQQTQKNNGGVKETQGVKVEETV